MMKTIGILYHPKKEAAGILAEKLKLSLESRGINVWKSSAWEVGAARKQVNGTELILTIGGDGTILRAVQTVVPEPIPITGINLGNLGFMTELNVDEVEDRLNELIDGKGWIDERYLLEAEVVLDDKQKSQKFYALNDVVLARGSVARVIHIETRINDELLTTYKADGVIVATATGSTGYSLAAQGPILYPQSRELLLVPIVPHLSSSYPLVLPDSAVIKLNLTTYHSATISIDGHINSTLFDSVEITVQHSVNTVKFLRIHPQNKFYSYLERKLRGKD
ncbi:MAG: NAD(+)/NADH kinase [Dehalococcoidales bacterium]|nr:MAG: NAD(+)/NADH kinase [Dehalococcoidales bacterium]